MRAAGGQRGPAPERRLVLGWLARAAGLALLARGGQTLPR